MVVDVHCTSDYSGIELPPTADSQHSKSRPRLTTFLLLAVWFGVVTGLIEGAGLMLFQRLNWASWGPMLHVSWPILWISPICDVIFFVSLALAIGLVARVKPRWPTLSTLIFLLSALAFYDWLTVTARLYHWSCLLLAMGAATAFTRWFSAHSDATIRFWRRSVLAVIAAGAVAFISVQSGLRWAENQKLVQLPPPSPGSPSVLVIVIDTLRADHLSGYGYSRSTSPNIDRMAEQGTLFENAISASSWSLPSHVSLLTGLYQFQHGVTNVQPMPVFGSGGPNLGGHLTVGEVLEHRGYRTAAFSANRTWFSHDLGFGRGFTHFEDYFQSPADMFIRTLFGRELSRIYLSRSEHSKPKRFLHWIGFDWLLDPDDEGVGVQGGAPGIRKRAPVVTGELIDWIDRDRSHRPFFAFLNYFDVHMPYGGPPAYEKPWSQNVPLDQYDDGVRYLDDSIGQLMSELDKRGLGRNTLVVITSDHGEGLGQHGLPTHGQALYREQIHVPLIFWYPGHIPAGRRIATNVSNTHIAATVLQVVNAEPDDAFPGSPLTALWSTSDKSTQWSDPISELAEDKYLGQPLPSQAQSTVPTASSGAMKSLLEGRWHLIAHSKQGLQLYNWSSDPDEVRDLIHTQIGREVGQRLSSYLQGKASAARSSCVPQMSLLQATAPAKRGPASGELSLINKRN